MQRKQTTNKICFVKSKVGLYTFGSNFQNVFNVFFSYTRYFFYILCVLIAIMAIPFRIHLFSLQYASMFNVFTIV